MAPEERRQLARALAAIDQEHPLLDPRTRRRRRFGLVFMTACCVALAAWVAILYMTLPGHFTSRDWRAVWVGLDIAELAGFAAIAWASWHQRQIVIFFMIITGTLLICDAWFDLALDYGSGDFLISLGSAVVVELPLAASYAAHSGRFDGVACLGAVIRGETDHYDFVCAETARGIQQVALSTGVPCAFGVLTCHTMEQALARSGGGKRDQGAHAAEAVLRMASLRVELQSRPGSLAS